MYEGELTMAELTKMMKQLTEVNGVSGFERQARRAMVELLEPLSDAVEQDRLGSIVGRKEGQAGGPRILLAGHLDEIGWMVTAITEGGFLRVQPLGGWWTHVMLAQKVTVSTRKGDLVGIFGSKPPHLIEADERSKTVRMDQMFLDIGARSRQEAEEMGVRPGDPITPQSDFFTMRDGELWAGKAIDNRAGCALAVEVLRRLQDTPHPNVVYAGATVQEEVGARGAYTVANLVQPDIAFALDVSASHDTPGLESIASSAKLDDGPMLFIYDAGLVGHEGLRNLILDTAEELNIPVQLGVTPQGGTDAARFHVNGTGCPSVAMGFAVRYIHSHVAVMSRKDFEQCADLVAEVIRRLDRAKVEELQGW